MTLTEMRYIVALARERHFGKAAEACHVSQPTLSVALKKVEGQLGAALFERTASDVRITALGERIVAQARRVLDEAVKLEEIAQATGDPMSGQIILAPGADEDKVMEVALEAGAEDVLSHEDGSIEVITAPNNDLATVKEALDAAGLTTVMAELAMKALNETDVSGDDAVKFQKMLDMLDDLDDVQEVFTSAILPE